MSAVGLGILTFALGLLIGAPLMIIAVRHSELVALIGLPAAPLLLALAVAVVCQRFRSVFMLTAVFVIAVALSAVFALRLITPYRPLIFAEPVDVITGAIGIASISGIVAIAFGMLAMPLMALFRLFVVRIVDQDGTLCARCGYCVSKSDSPTCPECGTARAAESAREWAHRFTHWVSRWRHAWIGGLAALLLAGVGWIVALELPFAQFDRTFSNAAGWRDEGMQFAWSTSGRGHVAVHRRGRLMTTETDQLMVAVEVGRDHPASRMWMRISVPHPHQFRIDSSGLRRKAEISTEVPPDETRRVLRDGIPQKVIDGLIARSRSADHQFHVRWERLWDGE